MEIYLSEIRCFFKMSDFQNSSLPICCYGKRYFSLQAPLRNQFFRFSEAYEMVTLKINRSLNNFHIKNPFVIGVTLYNDKPIAVLNMEKIINERKKEVREIQR